MNGMLPQGLYVFEWGGLLPQAGGLTKAMLTRLANFNKAGAQVVVLLSARGLGQLDAVEYYRDNGYSNIRESQFVTMEDFFAKKYSPGNARYPTALGVDDLLERVQGLQCYSSGGLTKYFQNGIPLVTVLNGETTDRRFEVVFHNWHPFRQGAKGVFWGGFLRQIYDPIDISPNGEATRNEYFQANNGFVFASALNKKLPNGKWQMISANVFTSDSEMVHFENQDQFRRFFFSSFVNDAPENKIFVFCDPFLDFNPGFNLMDRSKHDVVRIALLHGIGFGGDRRWYSQINPRTRDVVERAYPPETDSLVLLTNEALADYKIRLGDISILDVLPNTIKIPVLTPGSLTRNRMNAVYVGRLDEKQKRVSHIIRAFAKALEHNPDYSLSVYGRGADEQMLKELVKQLDIDDKVMFCGYSDDVTSVFQSAGFSILASPAEAFCLSCCESLANACPVVTYDFKYGPRDLIDDGINGLLVKNNDIDALSDAMISLYDMDDCRYEQMSRAARDRAMKYSEDSLVAKWTNLIGSIEKRRALYNNVSKLEVELISSKACLLNKEKTVSMRLRVYGVRGSDDTATLQLFARLYEDDMHSFDMRVVHFEIDELKGDVLIIEAKLKANFQTRKPYICLQWENTFIQEPINLQSA